MDQPPSPAPVPTHIGGRATLELPRTHFQVPEELLGLPDKPTVPHGARGLPSGDPPRRTQARRCLIRALGGRFRQAGPRPRPKSLHLPFGFWQEYAWLGVQILFTWGHLSKAVLCPSGTPERGFGGGLGCGGATGGAGGAQVGHVGEPMGLGGTASQEGTQGSGLAWAPR